MSQHSSRSPFHQLLCAFSSSFSGFAARGGSSKAARQEIHFKFVVGGTNATFVLDEGDDALNVTTSQGVQHFVFFRPLTALCWAHATLYKWYKSLAVIKEGSIHKLAIPHSNHAGLRRALLEQDDVHFWNGYLMVSLPVLVTVRLLDKLGFAMSDMATLVHLLRLHRRLRPCPHEVL